MKVIFSWPKLQTLNPDRSHRPPGKRKSKTPAGALTIPMKFSGIISQSLRFRRQLQNPNIIQSQIIPWQTNLRKFTTTPDQPNPPPSERVSAIVDELLKLTLLESADLTEVMRQKAGFKEMPMMAVMMPGIGFKGGPGVKGGGAAASKSEEKKAEKTVFDLKLEGFETSAKIKIIKEVRTFTALGLKEAKDLVEKTPTLLKKGVTKDEADKIIEKMKELGAKVTME